MFYHNNLGQEVIEFMAKFRMFNRVACRMDGMCFVDGPENLGWMIVTEITAIS